MFNKNVQKINNKQQIPTINYANINTNHKIKKIKNRLVPYKIKNKLVATRNN